MKNKILIYGLFIIIGATLGAGGYYYFVGQKTSKEAGSQEANKKDTQTKAKRKVLYWRAPMNPKEIYDHPGKSNMGMDLVPVYADASGESGVVSINPVIQQDMNVKTVEVKNGEMHADIITNGVLHPNEQKEYVATTKIAGWIEKLYINYTGQKVRKGDKLIKIYSPELVAAQQEYLTALAYDQAMKSTEAKSDLLTNAVRKLELLDVSASEIQRLKASKKVKKYIILTAPFDGTVLSKDIDEGAKINRGTPLLKIADLSDLWILADVYEYELDKIALGQETKVTFDYLPGKVYEGKISFIYPTLDTKTRTIKVRIDLPNRNGELKPGMFASVDIKGKNLGTYPLVPEQAVLRSGRQNTVIIALGKGKFKPAQVELGAYSNGYYQVLNGLQPGTKIVTSAQFLIDSESSLRAALSGFSEADTTKTKKMTDEEMKKMEKTDKKTGSE
jgi:Cu(I)/Ag(I) efflux system membrane fusion protein